MPKTKKSKPPRPTQTAQRKPAPRAQAPAPEDDPPIDLSPLPEEDTVSTAEVMEHVPCPYCDEDMEIMVHPGDDGKTRHESCSVCCRTVAMHIIWDDGQVEVSADRC